MVKWTNEEMEHMDAPLIRGTKRILEAVSQFKIPTKRSQNRVLYPKISIHFRKISDYGTSSLLRGVVDGAN
jgi:hypothetical protein